jgi:hypothetical protein
VLNPEPKETWGVDTAGVCPGCGELYEMFMPLRKYSVETNARRIGPGRFHLVAVIRRKRVFGAPRFVAEMDLHKCSPPGGGEAGVPAWPSDDPPSRTLAAEPHGNGA